MADSDINLESTDIRELLSAGIRSYAIGDFANAVAALGRTTQLMAQEHGDEHDKLGEIYIHYAKALLELSRAEAAPFGEGIVLEDSSSDSEDEENGLATLEEIKEAEKNDTKEAGTKPEKADKSGKSPEENSKVEEANKDVKVKESSDQNVTASVEGTKTMETDAKPKESSDMEVETTKSDDKEASEDKKAKESPDEKESGDKVDKTEKSVVDTIKCDEAGDNVVKSDGSGNKELKVSENGTSESDLAKPGGSSDKMDEDITKTSETGESSGTHEEKIEEPTDLQLAWEVLEVAKKIFTTRGEAGQEKVAETLILLGEVAMESGNFEDGTADMKAGLELQKSLYEPENRKLAETYYKLGNALATIPNIEDAVVNFEKSIESIQKRLKLLKIRLDIYMADEKRTDDDRTRVKDEIEEMKTLIPEIQEKISDTKSIKDEVAAKLFMEMANSIPNPIPVETKKEEPTSSKSINNITHLIKRKRKAEEESPDSKSALPTKKPTP